MFPFTCNNAAGLLQENIKNTLSAGLKLECFSNMTI